ncbi:unnamed protein product [Adineta steineri]|uniref:Transmembrane protein n=1 Tax=Adineta steineri TaxID=433720 RepID=A0A814YUQ8_9BILA|nr:unnamed protein product [Adineta steineri]CAF3613034.1 unnamed protein product [Adineta steineri]
MFVSLFLINFFSIINAITYSNTENYDAYGIRLASTDHFVVLAQNDALRYVVSMAPYGNEYQCSYYYNTSNDFVINIAVGRRQNASQLSFVYLLTNSTDGYYQKIGLYTFSRVNNGNSSNGSCNQLVNINEGTHEVKVWNRPSSEMSTLQVDLYGKYAYGFLSKTIFIYDIYNNFVKDFLWNDIFPSIIVEPHALDIGETNNGISMAIMAGYYQFDIGKTLPAVYLIRLNPPYNMTLIDNYTFLSNNQKYIQQRYTSTYQFDYVMSVSIDDRNQQVLVGIPQLSTTYLFSFSSTRLILINTFNYPARSITWLDNDGIQAGFLLSDVSTHPWAQSRIQIVNISSNDILYAYPNNQQTIEQWSSTPPIFIQLTKTYDYQLVILTTDGTVLLVPSAEAGYYIDTDDINSLRKLPKICPSGTYKSIRGTTPCTICPTKTRSSPPNLSSNSSNIIYPPINCTSCLSDSFCPLGSITDIYQSSIQSISQAYAYPTSSASPSFDDILMQNTFYIETISRRCVLISPFFWALITLLVAFIILIIMGILYCSPAGMKYFHRFRTVFRHSDLIGNGEFWFGGLISFAIILLIIYSFWFAALFLKKYPLETSTDATFVCDTSLRNAQYSSSLQLLTTIKTDQQAPIFDMLDMQDFTMTISFIQTGYTCNDVAAQENVGTYSVSLQYGNCTIQPDNATLTVIYRVPYHQITMQINLTGLYYIGGILICLTGPRITNNSSWYTVQEMNYCQFYFTSDQTIGETTEIYFSLTKVINQTDSLEYNGLSNYSGIWIPTSTHGSLNDRVAYLQEGAYHRYLYTQHTVIINFQETPFYVMNEQEPIARTAEILFHNVLFATTVISIFALAFVIFKLIFMPVVKWILKIKHVYLNIVN